MTNPHVFYMWKKRYSYAVSMASRKAKTQGLTWLRAELARREIARTRE